MAERSEMAAPTGTAGASKGIGSGGILGSRPELLLQSPLFGDFRFAEYEPAKPIGAGRTWHGYRPGAERIRDAATLNLEIDTEGSIDRLTLCLDRNLIERPADGSFARGLAAGFLTCTLSEAGRLALGGLIDEISNIPVSNMPAASDPAAILPRFPSPGYRVFLGHQADFDQELPDSQFRIVNLNWSRRRDQVATPPGYDGETMWLWLIARRHP
ncbi:MAG TPA: hypothetical protein VND94_15015 [Terriglobia bacterium]|nr:hypothetical protein [Terriglobia bacterium]